jgi:uncharacterized membrane protein
VSDLIVIVYPSEAKAEKIRQRFLDLQKEYVVELEDAVIATKTATGQVKLSQLVNATANGAIAGSFWGLLLGTIFLMPGMGLAAPVAGAALGAASGAIGGALADLGIDDTFMQQLAAKLQPGKAALFILVRKMSADKVLEAVAGTGETCFGPLWITTRSRLCATR